MVVRILRSASSIFRSNLSSFHQIRYFSSTTTTSTVTKRTNVILPYNFLLQRRLLSAASPALQQVKPASSTNPPAKEEKKENANAEPVTITFVTAEGERHTVQGKVGDSLLDVVIDKQIPLDGYGACEGTLACSTCHIVMHQKDYDSLPDRPSDEELDMLDLAYGLSDTSRLGCQVILKKEYEGMEVMVPASVHDARSEDVKWK